MIGIYLLVTIFSQFAPVSQFVNNWAWDAAMRPAPVESLALQVNFDRINDLKIGSPVLVDGRQVGQVSEIKIPEDSTAGEYSVSLSVSVPQGSGVGSDSIALQAAPMSASRTRAETVVELVSLPGEKGRDLKGGERLAGFSSIERFWSGHSSLRKRT